MASQSNYEVRPSDLDQAFVRVIFVSAVVVWSYINAPASTPSEALNYKYFNLAFAYWTFSLLAYAWTYFFLRRVSPDSKTLLLTRAVSIFADIGAISAYTAISDSFGVILFPIYLNSIIGYGYRFGVKYLYFTLAVAASFFSIALLHNEYLRASRELVIAYYLGMALVPLYSAALLKKHREVLERIRDLNDARSRFIANMSHELRTPLHAIISVSDVLKETLDDARGHVESRHQKMQMVSDSAQHLLGLVNKILDVASADAGKVPTRQREWINVVSVVQTALRICQPKAQQQGVEFYWFFDSRIPTWIRSSGEYLQEILINTVGNAVKYTKEGHVSVRVTYSEHKGTPTMAMDIIDTGIGISPKLLPNIFEPFTLGDDSAARRYAGTGLGLTLTKQYVELLGGEISFQSVENIGTHCRLLIPIEESREKNAAWPCRCHAPMCVPWSWYAVSR
jgi:two-component system sensor histidine kinase RpfC